MAHKSSRFAFLRGILASTKPAMSAIGSGNLRGRGGEFRSFQSRRGQRPGPRHSAVARDMVRISAIARLRRDLRRRLLERTLAAAGRALDGIVERAIGQCNSGPGGRRHCKTCFAYRKRRRLGLLQRQARPDRAAPIDGLRFQGRPQRQPDICSRPWPNVVARARLRPFPTALVRRYGIFTSCLFPLCGARGIA